MNLMRASLKYWNIINEASAVEGSIGALAKRALLTIAKKSVSGRFNDIADTSSLSRSSYHDGSYRSLCSSPRLDMQTCARVLHGYQLSQWKITLRLSIRGKHRWEPFCVFIHGGFVSLERD